MSVVINTLSFITIVGLVISTLCFIGVNNKALDPRPSAGWPIQPVSIPLCDYPSQLRWCRIQIDLRYLARQRILPHHHLAVHIHRKH